jgi:hypothetical protein
LLDEIGWASFRKQLASELIGDGQNARLHFEDWSPAKSFINDPPQPRVVGFIHRQHIIGERANVTGHPPPESGRRSALLAHDAD